eukprot:351916-Amorphochlora_amoeboformis.AAC.2
MEKSRKKSSGQSKGESATRKKKSRKPYASKKCSTSGKKTKRSGQGQTNDKKRPDGSSDRKIKVIARDSAALQGFKKSLALHIVKNHTSLGKTLNDIVTRYADSLQLGVEDTTQEAPKNSESSPLSAHDFLKSQESLDDIISKSQSVLVRNAIALAYTIMKACTLSLPSSTPEPSPTSASTTEETTKAPEPSDPSSSSEVNETDNAEVLDSGGHDVVKLFLDPPNTWMHNLCRVIHSSRGDDEVHKTAKRLLTIVAGSDAKRYLIWDSFLYKTELKKIRAFFRKDFLPLKSLNYAHAVQVVNSLSRVLSLAKARPKLWVRYSHHFAEDLFFIFQIAVKVSGMPVDASGQISYIAVLLLSLASEGCSKIDHAINPKQKPAKKSVGTTISEVIFDAASSDPTASTSKKIVSLDVNPFICPALSSFIRAFLLDCDVTLTRKHARSFIYLLKHRASPSGVAKIWSHISRWIPYLPWYGLRGREFVELLVTIVIEERHSSSIPASEKDTSLRSLLSCFRSQNQALQNSPNASLYSKLSQILGSKMGDYYLDVSNCQVCWSVAKDMSIVKLKTIQSEMKYTESKTVIKLSQGYLIQHMVIRVDDVSPMISVKKLRLYFNSNDKADLGNLKEDMSEWTLAKEISVSHMQKEIQITCRAAFRAANLMIEFADFHASPDGELEILRCPRCSSNVFSKHGLCSNCRENAYQCRQCRNINYENLEGYLCNECGFCRFAKFDYSVYAKPSLAVVEIDGEADRKQAMELVASRQQSLAKHVDSLRKTRNIIKGLISKIQVVLWRDLNAYI